MLASLLWLEELQYENESYLALFEVHSLVSGMKSFNLLQIVSRFLRKISLDLGDAEDVHSYQRGIQGMIRLPWGQGFVLALVLTLSTIGDVIKYIFSYSVLFNLPFYVPLKMWWSSTFERSGWINTWRSFCFYININHQIKCLKADEFSVCFLSVVGTQRVECGEKQ